MARLNHGKLYAIKLVDKYEICVILILIKLGKPMSKKQDTKSLPRAEAKQQYIKQVKELNVDGYICQILEDTLWMPYDNMLYENMTQKDVFDAIHIAIELSVAEQLQTSMDEAKEFSDLPMRKIAAIKNYFD